MRASRGGALLRICIVLIAAVGVYKAFTPEGAPASEKVAGPYIDPSYLQPQTAPPMAPAAPPSPELDLTRPMQTASYAIVCDKEVIFRALTSRRSVDDFEKVYDAFTSVFGRSEKVRAAGCEEWKRGVRVFQVQRMESPFNDFMSLSTSPDGDSDYFTMRAQLENLQQHPNR